MITWKRKGPKGCYRAVHEGRIVLLGRAKAPYDQLWLMHEPDGAEAMRAAAVEVASKRANLQRLTDSDMAWGRAAECILDELRNLSVPEDK